MSKDDGIYILRTKTDKGSEEYRIGHAHAIENLFPSRTTSHTVRGDKSLIHTMFEHSPVFMSLEKAREKAKELDQEHETEHGVLMMTQFIDLSWREIELFGELEHPSHV